jgi:truncated hemoglobin YjbI
MTRIDLDPGPSKLFQEIGGRDTLVRVHHFLYEKIYAHPWLKQFFTQSPRAHQEAQQTDFMTRVLGGPRVYSGRLPRDAHPHLFITDEVFDIRHDLLRQALKDAQVRPDIAETWLRLDEGFRAMLVKKSVDDCFGRYRTEEIIAPPRPSE